MEERSVAIRHYGFSIDGNEIPGGMTLAIDPDGRCGWSICSPFDRFEKRLGLYGRPADEDEDIPFIPGALHRMIHSPYLISDWDPGAPKQARSDLMDEIASEIFYSLRISWSDGVTLGDRRHAVAERPRFISAVLGFIADAFRQLLGPTAWQR